MTSLAAQLRELARAHGERASVLPDGARRVGAYAYANGLLDAAESIERGEVVLGTVRVRPALRVIRGGK